MSELAERLIKEVEIFGRHMEVLEIILKHGPIGIIKLSEMTGLPNHKIRYSLRVLEMEGLIKPSPEGAIATSKTEDFINQLGNILKELLHKMEEIYEKMPR